MPPSQVIRARLAPVALLIALAFVVVGFLRADREMTHAEQDRAALMASETATLVEVFLLRQIAQLQLIERAVELDAQSLATTQSVEPPKVVLDSSVQFEQVWLVVPSSHDQKVAYLAGHVSDYPADS